MIGDDWDEDGNPLGMLTLLILVFVGIGFGLRAEANKQTAENEQVSKKHEDRNRTA